MSQQEVLEEELIDLLISSGKKPKTAGLLEKYEARRNELIEQAQRREEKRIQDNPWHVLCCEGGDIPLGSFIIIFGLFVVFVICKYIIEEL